MDWSDFWIAIAVLAIPVVIGVPLRIIWIWRQTRNLAEVEYQRALERVLRTGWPIEYYRTSLDRVRRKQPDLTTERTNRVENRRLMPFRIEHFMLLPALAVWPLLAPLAMLVSLLALPLLRLAEVLLISRKVAARAVVHGARWFGLDLIHIPRADRGVDHVDDFHTAVWDLPYAATTGLFAWLIVHFVGEAFSGLLASISILIYVGMLGFVLVILAVRHSEIAFADLSQRRIVTIRQLVDQTLRPIVGVSLIILTLREIALESVQGGDPIGTAISVLAALYISALVGTLVGWPFARFRRRYIVEQFDRQIVEMAGETPSIAMARDATGTMRFHHLGRMADYLKEGRGLDWLPALPEDPSNFSELVSAPKATEMSSPTLPTRPKKPKRKKRKSGA